MCDRCPEELHAPEVEELTNPERRGFFRVLAGVAAAAVTLPAALGRAKQLAVNVSSVEALKKVGGSALLKVKDTKVLFIRDTETTVRAVNSMCTHKKCTVKFTQSDMQMHCPCHKSAYDLDGKVLGGPAPKPLQTFPAALDGDKIIVTMPDDPS